MKTLNDHNSEKLKCYAKLDDNEKPNTGVPNGIACPECGKQMLDTKTMARSYPPKRKVFCPACNYRDWKYE